MLKILRTIGIAFLLPGLIVLGYSLWNGSVSFALCSDSVWGVPVALFSLWIGLALACTLLTVSFRVLGVKLDRWTIALAGLASLCCLVLSVFLPLLHLGATGDFFLHIRDYFSLAVYGLLSSLLFINHLGVQGEYSLKCVRKPLAWLLLPLVFWVYALVGFDFSLSFLGDGKRVFVPAYQIVGVFYSGLALVNGLLCAEGFRVRMLERLMEVCSWFFGVIMLWNFLERGCFYPSVFVLAVVLPQLWWVSAIRDSRFGRLAICLFVLAGVFIERICLVSPAYEKGLSSLGFIDLGVIPFSLGLFMLLFYGLRRWVGKFWGETNSYFGEVDGSEIEADITKTEKDGSELQEKYEAPFTSVEFKAFRLPFLLGVFAVLILIFVKTDADVPLETSVIEALPLTYPLFALVSGISLFILGRNSK